MSGGDARTEGTEFFDDSLRKYHTEAQRAQRGPRGREGGIYYKMDRKAHAEAQRAQRIFLSGVWRVESFFGGMVEKM